MADEPENEDETLELTEDLQVEQSDADEHQDDDEQPEPKPEDGDEEETVVSFGDPADIGEEQPDDNKTMRQMRARIRELEKDKREREAAAAAPKKALRPKPTLEDHGYDEEAYDADKAAWDKEVAESEEADKRVAEEQREIQEEWNRDLQSFAQKKQALRVPDVEECQAIVEEALNGVQQSVMLKATRDPALFMVALAKAPAKLAELAKIKDVIKLGAEMARMEGGIKVVTKRKGPNIDTPERGSGKMPAKNEVEKQLAKLQKAADDSGDLTELIRFKKQNGLR